MIGGKNFSHDRVDSYVKVGVDDVDVVLVALTSANEIMLCLCPFVSHCQQDVSKLSSNSDEIFQRRIRTCDWQQTIRF